MPSDFHPAARSKLDCDHSRTNDSNMDHFACPLPGSEFMELLWQNGQIVMQGQSSRSKKNSIPGSSFQPTNLREKEGGDCVLPKINRIGVMDSVANDFPTAGISSQMGSNTRDDEHDMVPWLTYPIDDYGCLEFLSEFSGSNTSTLPVHDNSTHDDNGSRSCSQVPSDSHSSDQNVSPKESNGGSFDSGRTWNVQLFNQMPQQWPGSISQSKTRTSDVAAGITTGLPDAKLQRKDLVSPPKLPSPPPASTGSPGLLNFSHFARPVVALLKANLESSDRMRNNERASTTTATSTDPLESTLIGSSQGFMGVSESQTAVASDQGDSKSTPQLRPEHVHVNHHSEAAKWEDATRDNKIGIGKSKSPALVSVKASLPGSRHVTSKNSAPVVASSVCSASGARNNANKRKIQEGEEFGCYQSEDLDDESAAAKKMPSYRGTTAKRSRAAEVHNLSERRRRDRINEKMRALQELIPNCNKADKASMLDEAIEYLKTLQLQVQIMSMGSGLCMPHMMLPPGMQHHRAPHMAHFPTLGMGYGMRVLDMNGSPMFPMPPIHGLQFPCSVPGNPVMSCMARANGLQMFGVPGQGHLVPTNFGVPPVHSSRVNTAPEASGMTDASLKGAREMVPFSGLKDQDHHDTHIPRSPQTTKECRGDSSSAQIMTNASRSSDGPLNSTSGNRNSSTGTSGTLD